MEYVFAALLLHKAGKKVDEAGVKKVIEAAGVKVDDAKVKALVASLEGVNIDEVLEKAATAPVVQAGSAPEGEQKKEPEEKKKEEKKEEATEEQAAAGLGALFG